MSIDRKLGDSFDLNEQTKVKHDVFVFVRLVKQNTFEIAAPGLQC